MCHPPLTVTLHFVDETPAGLDALHTYSPSSSSTTEFISSVHSPAWELIAKASSLFNS